MPHPGHADTEVLLGVGLTRHVPRELNHDESPPSSPPIPMSIRRVLFIGEILFLGFLTTMLGMLTVLVVREGSRPWTALLIPAGLYGLGALWWMVLAFGRARPPSVRRVPLLVWAGFATGVLLALGLLVAVGLEAKPGLLGQALLLLGAPIVIAIDMLLCYRRWKISTPHHLAPLS